MEAKERPVQDTQRNTNTKRTLGGNCKLKRWKEQNKQSLTKVESDGNFSMFLYGLIENFYG